MSSPAASRTPDVNRALVLERSTKLSQMLHELVVMAYDEIVEGRSGSPREIECKLFHDHPGRALYTPLPR